MRNRILISLRKINYMKFTVVLFCLLSTLSFAQRGKKQARTESSIVSTSGINAAANDFDQMMQFVVNDFAAELKQSNRSEVTIVLLDSYTQLVNKSFTANGTTFVAGGKPEVQANNGVVMAFWRLDIKENTAHIEFYYTDSKNQTTHHEYKLTKENAVWRK